MSSKHWTKGFLSINEFQHINSIHSVPSIFIVHVLLKSLAWGDGTESKSNYVSFSRPFSDHY